MFSFTEQFSAATATAKSQLDKQINIANEYATTAFEGVQQIIALNVSATKASVEKSSAAAKQLFEAKDPAEFFKLNPAQAPSLDNILAYGRELASIASKTQAELLEVVKEQIKDVSAAGASVAAKLPTPDAGAAATPFATPFTAPFPNPFAGLFANPFASPASAPASAPVAAPVSAPPAPAAPVAKAPAAAVPPTPAAAPVAAQPEAEAEPEPAAPATVVNPPAPKAVAAAVAEAVAPEQEETAAQKPGKAKAAAPKANAAGESVSLKAIKK